MNNPAGRSADPYAALAEELSVLGHRLGGLAVELRALRASAGSTVAEPTTSGQSSQLGDAQTGEGVASGWEEVRGAATGSTEMAPVPLVTSGAVARPPYGHPPAPYWAAAHGEQAYPGRGTGPHHPPVPSRRRWFPALSGARLLAWTGGAVTLLGVLLLLVLAAAQGWFGPPLRVAGGALLGAALIGIAARLHRRPGARTGALAVAATGFATLYLVAVAAAALYGYLAPAPALLVALLVAGVGLGVAERWRSPLLGCGVVVGAAVLAPVLALDWLLVALVSALQLAALPVLLRRDWPVLMLLAASGPVLYGCAVGRSEVTGPGGLAHLPTVAVVLGTLLVGLATATAVARRGLADGPVGVLVAVSALPTLVAGSALDGPAGAGMALLAAAVLAGVAAVTGGQRATRLVAASAAALALFLATLIALEGTGAVTVVLGVAVLAAVASAAVRSGFALVVGMALGAYGVLAALAGPLPPPVAFPMSPYATPAGVVPDALVTAAGIAALVVALAVAVLVAGGRAGWIRPDSAAAGLWVPTGLVGLFGAGTLVVSLALLVAPHRAGFTAGHAAVTVSWTVVALVLLARGITRPALRATGLVLVVAAVAKLVLFDLVALDGIARVAAFLGAGLLLLAAGTRYARLVADAGAASPVPTTAGPR